MTQQRRGSLVIGAFLAVILICVLVVQLVFAFSHVSKTVHRLRLQNDAERAQSVSPEGGSTLPLRATR